MCISVISSYAEDRVIYENGIIVKQGGPATFITRLLDKMNIDYNLYSKGRGIVEIDKRDTNEIGKIVDIKRITSFPDDKGLVLISTLADEFPLRRIGDLACLDVQGYVRDMGIFGAKRIFDSIELEKFDIIKGTREEIRYIPEERIKKVKIMIITNGQEGFTIKTPMTSIIFPANIIKTGNTIGAGDTLFTAFCVKYYTSKNLIESAEFARRKTEEFLEDKS